MRQGCGPLGYLLTDKTMAPQLGHAARQLAGTTDTLAASVASLRHQVQAGRGPVHTLLSDTALSGQLRQTVRNAAQSTHRLDESMVALQHNFLLRGYFRKQAKHKAQTTADSAARPKASASR